MAAAPRTRMPLFDNVDVQPLPSELLAMDVSVEEGDTAVFAAALD